MTERGKSFIGSLSSDVNSMLDTIYVCSHSEADTSERYSKKLKIELPCEDTSNFCEDTSYVFPYPEVDTPERDSKKLKIELPREDTSNFCEDTSDVFPYPEGYIDVTESMPPDAIEPDWPSLYFEKWYLIAVRTNKEWIQEIQETKVDERLRICFGGKCPALSGTILEIFSLSIHWNEENTGGMQYRLYGNVFIEDLNHDCGCCLKAMKRSLQDPFIVSNGGNIPLRGLDRCIFCRDYICFFVCLLGHRFDSGFSSRENESVVLVKKDVILYVRDFPLELGKPVERTFAVAAAGDLPFLKMHYSVMRHSFVVGVEVRLVCSDIKKHFGMDFGTDVGKFCIGGTLSVHWLQFEEWLEGGELHSYKIMLLDTEQQDKSTLRLRLGECFPIWRHKLAVSNGYTLVFDADIRTTEGYVFKGNKNICVENNTERFYVLTFGDGSLNMQITLFNYYCL